MPPPAKSCDVRDMGALTSPLKFLDQDYQKLLQESLSRKELYTDELFPPNSCSIGNLSHKRNKIDYSQIVWKRPSELVTNPCFIVDGVSRFDYKQGHLGNCWFLASVGALTFQKDITKQVIPAEQSFSKNYAGIFHFKFWRFGEWIDVVIDDLLPTFNEKLVFVHPKTSNEFWPALLEKAYAKVCGSYADLDSGRRSESMLDFTGGVHLHFVLNEAPAYLWNIMKRAARAQSLMCCGTHKGEAHKHCPSNGIVGGHAYTVTGVSKVMSNSNPVKLVRVLNPWGRKEWTGDWSDQSPLWSTVSGTESKKCHEVLDNGEFWMSVEDFTKFFKSLDICCLSADFLDRSSGCHWKSQRCIGEWTENTAGGSIQTLETFCKNPQFRVRIEELNEACPHEDAENIVVSLIQNNKKRHRKEQKHYNIGFYVFEMKGEQVEGGQRKVFDCTNPVAECFAYQREVMKFLRLEPGEYLIVPCTENPGETASFVLSVFSKHETYFE
ncbi:calpain-1 catalytic subunit-like [Labeo rohita]|uniref:calpain-1 catalytic subunit-like n=1 Tax=Labeo rohita TaxID=84645 RepID=UPI0021E31F5D|nr:calpain-1 catalytic subunit-like [Labeo rohita]